MGGKVLVHCSGAMIKLVLTDEPMALSERSEETKQSESSDTLSTRCVTDKALATPALFFACAKRFWTVREVKRLQRQLIIHRHRRMVRKALLFVNVFGARQRGHSWCCEVVETRTFNLQ